MNIIICYAITFLVEAFILKHYCSTLFISKYSSTREWLSILGAYSILFAISRLEIVALNTCAFLIINFILMWYLYETTYISAFFHSTIITIIMGFSELIVAGLNSQNTFNLYESESYLENVIILAVFSKQIYFLVVFVISRIFVKSKIQSQHHRKDLLLLLTIPLVSLWVLNTFNSISYYVALPTKLNNMVTVSSFLLLIATLVIWSIYIYTNKKNQEFTEMQLQLQKEYDSVEYYKMLLTQHENQNILIHDIKKHLQSIALLNDQQEHERITAYINQIIHSSDLQTSTRVCDNDFLNAIISRYIRYCKEQNITFRTDIRSQAVDFLEENDLTSLFCNLLDNAVESTKMHPNSFIELSIIYRPQINLAIITMVNTCRKNPFSKQSKKLISTKSNSERHGFGIKSMKRIVKKYSGNMELYYDEEEKAFHTIITLKLPEK